MFNIIEFVCTNIQPFPEYSHIEEEKSKKTPREEFCRYSNKAHYPLSTSNRCPISQKKFCKCLDNNKKMP